MAEFPVAVLRFNAYRVPRSLCEKKKRIREEHLRRLGVSAMLWFNAYAARHPALYSAWRPSMRTYDGGKKEHQNPHLEDGSPGLGLNAEPLLCLGYRRYR